MSYIRVNSSGQSDIILDTGGRAADLKDSLLTHPSNLPLAWRPLQLRDPRVEQVAITQQISSLFQTVAKEPMEQIHLVFGLARGSVFHSLDVLNISTMGTSGSVEEIALRRSPAAFSCETDLQILLAVHPELRCIVCHNHPFSEENKLQRLFSDPADIVQMLSLARQALATDYFPHLNQLKPELRMAAAINELTCSVLSEQDLRFTGPNTFQLLSWESPGKPSGASLAAFQIDSDLQANELKPVVVSSHLPPDLQSVQRQIQHAQELACQLALTIVQTIASKKTDCTIREYFALERQASQLMTEMFLPDLLDCIRTQGSPEDLLRKIASRVLKL